jgi:predicted transcriptional regulator
MPNPPMIDLTLDAEIEVRLQRLADVRQLPARGLVREAIEQYVEREEARETLRQQTLAAWSEYQSTGRHVTAEEADVWLSRLEAGEDADPPSPHICRVARRTFTSGLSQNRT